MELRCGGSFTFLCSATSQDSKAEYRREVATPEKIRPTKRTLKSLKCFVTQPLVYVKTYSKAAFFLPLQQYTRLWHSYIVP